MNNKVLITGNKGFLGTHLQKNLEERGCEVFGYDRDDDCIFPEVDYVFHFAAMNGTHGFYRTPYEIEVNDIFETINVLEHYSKTDTKIIFASSSELYNDAFRNGLIDLPFSENTPVCFNDMSNPRWSYGIPKLVGESLLHNASKEFDTSFTILRYFNIYGPGQKNHFIPDFIERAFNKEFYIIGNDPRSFMYIDDAIKTTIDIAFHLNSNKETYNIGDHKGSYLPSDIAYTIMFFIDPKDESKLEILEPNGLKGSSIDRIPDTKKARDLLCVDTLAKTEISKGLQRTIEWVQKER